MAVTIARWGARLADDLVPSGVAPDVRTGEVRPAPPGDSGTPVGYKAGLTSAAAKERFGVDPPVRGVPVKDMLSQGGA